MSYSCDWVIYPLPSKTQSYVASVILNEYIQVIDRITTSLKNMEIWEENIVIFLLFVRMLRTFYWILLPFQAFRNKRKGKKRLAGKN